MKRTADAYWDAIGNDFEGGLARVAARDSKNPEAIILILAEAADQGTKRAPLLNVLLTVAIVGLALAALYSAGRLVFTEQVVMLTTPVPAFHILAEEDVRLGLGFGSGTVLKDRNDVIGHLTLVPLDVGDALHKDNLTGSYFDTGAVVLTLNTAHPVASLERGQLITMILSPVEPSATDPVGGVEVDATLLDVAEQAVTVAVEPSELTRLKPRLGSSVVFVARTAGAPTALETAPRR